MYFDTLRYLKLRQIAGRLVRPLRRRWTRLPEPPRQPRGTLNPTISFPEHEPWNRRSDIIHGTFCFLHETQALGRPVDWQPDAPLLWKFNLHYFNYLHLLGGEEQADLCREWIAANPLHTEPGWHPYPTSLRIVNWCKAEIEAQDLLRSLYQQGAYLYRNPETHLLGNHLLENARALVLAGCFFGEQGEASRWLERGLELYRRQTPEQILGDGGHFERSPMYHALVLEGHLDVLNVLPTDHPDREWLADTVRRMGDFLVSVTHPNGRIALFNDATREIAVPTERLRRYAENVVGYEPTPRNSFPETGYFVCRDEDTYLIIDGGPIGPDYLPAHAHADIFSYELSVEGRPFIVDTGVYEYEAGDMREYVRSTKAHNTVCVDGVDQAECWEAFRVARRYSPKNVSFEHRKSRSVFEGTFEGYAHLIGDQIEHHRSIEVDSRERQITIEDTVTGRGEHTVRSRIHLHPEVDVQRNREAIELERDACTVELSTGDSTVRLENGWYCPEFGVRKSNTVIVFELETALPSRICYSIHY